MNLDVRPESREPQLTLAEVARAGFQDLSAARDELGALAAQLTVRPASLLAAFAHAADPDAALIRIRQLADEHVELVSAFDDVQLTRLCRLIGASPVFGDFFTRRPERLAQILRTAGRLIGRDEAYAELRSAIADASGGTLVAEAGWNALRVRYRELLAELMLFDLHQVDPTEQFEAVAHSLSDLAGGALEASLRLARAALVAGSAGPAIAQDRVDALRLSIVAMGKCGAEELNVVSDVDVVFIVDSSDETTLDQDALVRLGTRLASETMRGIHDPALEPPLWQVDANLRPEGRQGALVRTLRSMLTYYDRWAKGWEFQALLKARPIAGDRELGRQFVAETRDGVWASSSRDDFVGSVQRMRRRVTEHIADDDLEVQLKLGPGGLRDIEFSAQLLQLVHGQYDETLHLGATLPALRALVEGGYIARSDGERLADDYEFLRVLEHRLQLRELRRTALMPTDTDGLHVLARASGLATTGEALRERWERTKRDVRELHLKIFYAPLLSAVAALPEEELVLGSEAASARLQSIGFRDPEGAKRNLAALTRGTSRRARIQRNLMPVLLQWFADGTDPDFGLLAFRRVSEANTDRPWYLRLLRDGVGAAERLTHVLSCSRFAADLLETIPDAVAWLERDELLRPASAAALLEEMRALASRRPDIADVAKALRAVHRREVLRLALGRVSGVTSDLEVAHGLDAAHTALLEALLTAIRRDTPPVPEYEGRIEIALIGMGRYGGGELGFASDIDLVAVYRAPEGVAPDRAAREATRVVTELRRLVSDPRFPVDLDFDLRPEGKSGPLARSLDSFASYYARWSGTWETQALLRARFVAGDRGLGDAYTALIDPIRYPQVFGENEVREIRRMKARVEAERLPQGAEPERHLKLGPGGVSDVEWLIQLLQLREAGEHPELRSVSTLRVLDAATELELLSPMDASQLVDAWRFASRARSALMLWDGRATDSLPAGRGALAAIAAIIDVPGEKTSDLEEHWFTVARRARRVFERGFFGYSDNDQYPLLR